MGQVNLDLAEYNELKAKITASEARMVELEQQLVAERAIPTTVKTRDLVTAYASAKVCVDFMVANLDPEFIRDMPYQELQWLAELVERVGGDGQRDGERAMIWKEHVRRIMKYETERQLRARAQPSLELVPQKNEDPTSAA